MRRPVFLLLALALAACDGAEKPAQTTGPEKIWEEFSGETALQHVARMVELGPRPPGSEALEKSRVYLTQQLEAHGWSVARQTFQNHTPRGEVTFVNLIAHFRGQPEKNAAPPSFLLCSHYDTKFFETETFVGANDGGSSNGVLLEMARVLALRPDLAAQVKLVFFDGEEAYVAFTDTDGFYGSRHFAKELVAAGTAKQFRGGLLFDMVGDRELTVTLPPDSPRQMVRDLFATAEALQVRRHFTYADGSILDDHTALNQIGIPVVDIIDFDYPPWHTPADTMDKLSAESLRIVGAVGLRYLAETALK